MTSQTNPEAAALGALADRCEAATGADNALDVLIEIALFKPEAEFTAIRANYAGTKVIYTKADGREVTHWAGDWTMDRSGTAAALRSRIASLAQGGFATDGEKQAFTPSAAVGGYAGDSVNKSSMGEGG